MTVLTAMRSGPGATPSPAGLKAILAGGLLAGALDYLAAMVASGSGFAPVGRFIASGVYGPAAFEGGVGMAAQGVLFHFGIMMVIAATYVGASRVQPTLVRLWPLWGPLFGIAVYFAMREVVVPLSNAVQGDPPLWRRLIQVGIHMVFVGLPIAFCAARVR